MSKTYEALKKAQVDIDQAIERNRSSIELHSENVGVTPQSEGLSSVVETIIPKKDEPAETVEPMTPEETVHGFVDKQLVTFIEPRSAVAVQFKKIWTLLCQHKMGRECKSIMITSALPGEGKTLTACNLGVTITQGLDNQVFLVDCDLRRPAIHHLFGFDGKPGLAEFLMNKREISEIIHNVEGLGLKIIPAGMSPESASELLSSDKMAEFFGELKARYKDHYIIIDTTPLLLTAEPGILASMVDGIILVIMAGKTPRDAVNKAVREVKRENVIGVVFNKVESREGYYSKKYGGHDYYHSTSSRKW